MTALLREGGRPLWAFLALALLIRIAAAFWPVLHHADENWQYLEPARHLVSGPWIETWEYRAGARSWLLPLLFAGPMALGQLVSGGSLPDMVFPRLLCALISLAGIIGAAGLGARISRRHCLVAAFVAAFWFEFAYFGARTLSEPIAVALFLPGAWLLAGKQRHLAGAGLLLGLCCLVRFQYAPAVLAFAAWELRGDARAWLKLAAGGAAALAAGALVDLSLGTLPYAWVFENFRLNIVEQRSAGYGTAPFYWYLAEWWRVWPLLLLPILAFALLGARRYPGLMAAALVNLGVHSLIGHKEYRFILLTTALVVLLAAIGSVDAWERWRRAPRRAWPLYAAWLVAGLSAALLGEAQAHWSQNARLIAAWRDVRQTPGLCGVGVYRMEQVLVASHAMLGSDVPIHQYDDATAPAALRSRAFNVLLAPRAHGGELPGFALRGCAMRSDRYCVYARPGPCSASPADAAHEANRVIERSGY